jgi:hypothetical protein
MVIHIKDALKWLTHSSASITWFRFMGLSQPEMGIKPIIKHPKSVHLCLTERR